MSNGILPTDETIRLHFTPPARSTIPASSEITFSNATFQVQQVQDIQQYSLGNDNLYTFKLQLQETSY